MPVLCGTVGSLVKVIECRFAAVEAERLQTLQRCSPALAITPMGGYNRTPASLALVEYPKAIVNFLQQVTGTVLKDTVSFKPIYLSKKT